MTHPTTAIKFVKYKEDGDDGFSEVEFTFTNSLIKKLVIGEPYAHSIKEIQSGCISGGGNSSWEIRKTPNNEYMLTIYISGAGDDISFVTELPVDFGDRLNEWCEYIKSTENKH